MAKTYRDLIVWQRSISLAEQLYAVTATFPKSELYGLVSQIRRNAVSIPSNIAEGNSRRSKTDYARFITIAMGTVFELETQLLIARNVGYMKNDEYEELSGTIDNIEALLAGLRRKLENNLVP
jgi:four helix bundle protein